MKKYDTYKDSKLRFNGEIPLEWDEAKIKHYFEIGRGRVISQLELKKDGIYPVFSSQTKNDGCMGYIDTYDFDEHQLTWTTDGANAGEVFERIGRYNCTNVCGTLKPKKNLSIRFFLYQLQYLTKFYKRPDTNGAKIMNNEMAEIHCLIPSLIEQKTIASFLDHKTTQIDTLIEKKEQLVEKLTLKRQAIINEAVTKGLNPDVPMKDSGIEWLGEVPEHWDLLKIGRSFSSIGSGTTPKSTNSTYYNEGNINWLNTGDLNDSYITETSKKITQTAVDEFSTLKEYPIDSIVIALYGATIGKLGHLKIPTTTNQACCVISGSDKIQQRFLFYYFLAARDYIISLSYGGGQPNISQDLIRQLYIPTPVNVEQNKIISFLDHKTTQIDTLIEKKEQLVEKLTLKRQAIINEAVTKGLNPDVPMKDSGIEWLGEIPEHWDMKKLKYFAKIRNGKDQKEVLIDEGGYPVLGTGGEFGRATSFLYDKSSVLLGRKGTINNPLFIEEPFWTVDTLFYTEIKEDIFPKYFFYLCKTIHFDFYQESSAVPSMTQDNLNNILLCWTYYNEQVEIADYIDRKMEKIDSLIEKVSDSINKLKLYRQSLISEAVTGKIDLRDWKQKDNK